MKILESKWAGVFLGVGLIAVLVMSISKTDDVSIDLENRIINDSLVQVINSRELNVGLKVAYGEKIAAFKKAHLKDTLIKKTSVIKLINDNHKYTMNLTDSLNLVKIKSYTSVNRPYLVMTQLKQSEPNYWLLAFIVLISGVLGGVARTMAPDFESLKEKVNQVRDLGQGVEATMSLKGLEAGQNDGTDQINVLNTEIEKLNQEIEKLKAGDNENVMVNIVFGIIASAVSFLALTTFRSEVLAFNAATDYFVFLGWCLLGAVFAKQWIKALYNKITTSST